MKATAEFGREALLDTVRNSPSDYGKVKCDVSVAVPCRRLLESLFIDVQEDNSRVEVALKRNGRGKIDGVRSLHVYGGKEGGNVHVNFTDGDKGRELGRRILGLLLGEGKMDESVGLGGDVMLKVMKIYNWREGHDMRTNVGGQLRDLMKADWDTRSFRKVPHVRKVLVDAMDR